MPKMTAAPKMPPTTWAPQAHAAWRGRIFFASSMPSVTAGLMWQPLIGPMTYAMISSAKPNERATPTWPSSGERIAAPGPSITSTAVPTNSAATIGA